MNEKQLKLTRVPKELQLILACLKNENIIQQNLLINIDWDLFLRLAIHHRVYPVIHQKISKLKDFVQVPSFVIKYLQAQYRRNTFKMLQLSSAMEEISKLFSNNNIRLLFLKGPTLGHDLYGDISLRTSSDLDVLIPIEQLEKVEGLLLKQGYKKDDYIETVLNDWKWRHHHVVYIHPEKGIKLEIHWRLHPGPGKEPGFNELWSRKCRTRLTNSEVYILKEEDLLVYLISHGARHGWSRLRWLHDIHQLINKGIDWHYTLKILKRYRSFHIGGQAMVLMSQLIGTEVSYEIRASLESKKAKKLADQTMYYLESMINLHTDPVPIEVSRYHKHFLFSLMSFQQKVLFVLSFLYPYPEDAETLRLPKRLHFLYFPLRPLLWAWRKTRKHALT